MGCCLVYILSTKDLEKKSLYTETTLKSWQACPEWKKKLCKNKIHFKPVESELWTGLEWNSRGTQWCSLGKIIHDRMKVNNTDGTGAKVGWEKRRGCGEVSESAERKGGRLNPHTIIIRTHMQSLLWWSESRERGGETKRRWVKKDMESRITSLTALADERQHNVVGGREKSGGKKNLCNRMKTC